MKYDKATIIQRIDVLSELRSLGLRAPESSQPNAAGWMSVHSPVRQDKLVEKPIAREILESAWTDLVKLYGLELTAVMMGSAALAIIQDRPDLRDSFDARVAIWLVGPSGCGKTDWALLAMRWFGSLTRSDIPSWNDTANAVQMEASTMPSVPVVCDDWKGSSFGRGEADRAKRVLQAYCSGKSRTRMTSSGRFNTTSQPIGCV